MTNPAATLATLIADGFETILRAALSANQAAVDAVCQALVLGTPATTEEEPLDFAMFDLPRLAKVAPRRVRIGSALVDLDIARRMRRDAARLGVVA